MNSSFIIALLLVMAPLAFAAFLLFFMMSGKGTKPLDNSSKEDSSEEQKEKATNTDDL
jgi:flagellar basal body-associated protein FliL